jgi:2-amino-4-hydroxy-6-hydroxymethyldihydropteridine diphosphokinase
MRRRRADEPRLPQPGQQPGARANLRSAARALRERFGPVLLSPVYRTGAVGFDGPDFLNAAA